MKKPMGIFIIRSKVNNKCYIQTTQDLKGVMNSAVVRLEEAFIPIRNCRRNGMNMVQIILL